MATSDWTEIYRSYDGAALAAEITKIRGELSVYSTQSFGTVSGTRDLKEIRDRLQAAIRVQAERSGSHGSDIGVPDFSGVRV